MFVLYFHYFFLDFSLYFILFIIVFGIMKLKSLIFFIFFHLIKIKFKNLKMWSTKSFLGDIHYNLNKIKQNSKYFQSKKIHSSSMDKNIFPITKLTKTPFRKFFKKKIIILQIIQ